MKLRIILALCLFLFCSASFSWALGEKARLQPAPDFSLPDLQGNMARLSDYKGKVVFLHFWLTTCQACEWELPFLQRLYDRLKGKHFELLAVAIDSGGRAVVGPFIQSGGYGFKVLLDPGGKVYAHYPTWGVPNTFIIDQQGRVLDKIVGARQWDDRRVVNQLKELIEGK